MLNNGISSSSSSHLTNAFGKRERERERQKKKKKTKKKKTKKTLKKKERKKDVCLLLVLGVATKKVSSSTWDIIGKGSQHQKHHRRR